MEEYPPIRKNRLWEMEVITFEGSWLLDQLRQEPTSPVPLDMHRLEALIFAHKSRAQKWQPFAIPMYPTDGPIDAVIHQLAQWAFDKMILEGKTPEREVCPVESFSFAHLRNLPREHWCIMLEIDLPEPCYLYDPCEGWVRV